MENVICPYCGAGQEIDHTDGYGYEEDEIFQQECENCEKTFTYETSITFSYDVHKCDCMNGGKHKWELMKSIPICYSKMICYDCGETRELTHREKLKYKIPNPDEYFEDIDF